MTEVVGRSAMPVHSSFWWAALNTAGIRLTDHYWHFAPERLPHTTASHTRNRPTLLQANLAAGTRTIRGTNNHIDSSDGQTGNKQNPPKSQQRAPNFLELPWIDIHSAMVVLGNSKIQTCNLEPLPSFMTCDGTSRLIFRPLNDFGLVGFL
jgi:hypothetical protein